MNPVRPLNEHSDVYKKHMALLKICDMVNTTRFGGSNGMKMIMISYNEAIDMEVMEALEKCNLKNYTKVAGTYGKGRTSGTHLGSDIWPGRNNILYVALRDEDVKPLMSSIKDLRKALGSEGVKAFVLPLEEVT